MFKLKENHFLEQYDSTGLKNTMHFMVLFSILNGLLIIPNNSGQNLIDASFFMFIYFWFASIFFVAKIASRKCNVQVTVAVKKIESCCSLSADFGE